MAELELYLVTALVPSLRALRAHLEATIWLRSGPLWNWVYACDCWRPTCLLIDSLEHIVDEWVHDTHRPLGDSGFWMHLLQHPVDVHWISFDLIGLLSAWATLSSLSGAISLWSASASSGRQLLDSLMRKFSFRRFVASDFLRTITKHAYLLKWERS